MSANVGPSDAERYGWPEAGEGPLSLAATRIARNLARSGARVIGFLPVDDRLDPGRLGPVLLRAAEALTGFVAGELAVVDTWPTWPWGIPLEVGATAAPRLRQIAPRVLEIAPPPCNDAPVAGVVLRESLAACPARLARVLVNLGGYATPGAVPQALEAVDAVVLLVAARRSRQAAVSDLARRLPPGKSLGAVLVG
jgi:hypothetical protein